MLFGLFGCLFLFFYGSMLLYTIIFFSLMVHIKPKQSEALHLLLGEKAVCKLRKSLKTSIVWAFLFIILCVINHFFILCHCTDSRFPSENEQIKKYIVIGKRTKTIRKRKSYHTYTEYHTQMQRSMEDMYFKEWQFSKIKPSEKIITDKIKSIIEICHISDYNNKEIPKSFDTKIGWIYNEFSEGDTCLIIFKSSILGKVHIIKYQNKKDL